MLGNFAIRSQLVQNKRSASGYMLNRLSAQRLEGLAFHLPKISYDILFNGKTETSYTGRFLDYKSWSIVGPRGTGFKQDGVFVNPVGKLPLFNTTHKFTSGTGWPSFYKCFDEEHISHVILPGKGYTKVVCARTGLHLGHCFPDKPPPILRQKLETESGEVLDRFAFQRFCINAYCLEFLPQSQIDFLESYRDFT